MRVLHVIGSVSPVRGGPSNTMHRLARGLAHHGLSVDVATTDDDGPGRMNIPVGKPIMQDGATYWFFPVTTAPYTVSLCLSSWIARHARDYDLLHIHGLFSYPANAASLLSAIKGIPYVLRPVGSLGHWGMRNRRPFFKRLSFSCVERPLLSRAAAVHYTTEQEKEEASELCFAHNAVVIPNPMDDYADLGPATAEWFVQSFPSAEGRQIILFLGRLHPVKALECLIEAFSLVRVVCPKAVLVLAGSGDGEYVASLRRRVKLLELNGDVIWAGLLRAGEVRSALAAATVCVLPSHSENFGIAALDAMQAGKPIVVTPGVALHREIARGGAGIVVPPDPAALAEAFVRLLKSPEIRDSLGARARKLALEHFSTQVVGHELMLLYEQIVSSSSGRRPPVCNQITRGINRGDNE